MISETVPLNEQGHEEQKRAFDGVLKAIIQDCGQLKAQGKVDSMDTCTKLQFRGLTSFEDAKNVRLLRVFRDDIDPVVAQEVRLLNL